MAMPKIRPAYQSDAESLSNLLAQLGHPSSVAYISRQIERIKMDDREVVLVALDEGGTVVGMLALQVADQFHEEPSIARILDLCVLDSQRGKTYGRQLLAEAERIARHHHCCRLEVTANNFRRGAHQFYAMMGMDQTHRYFAKKI